MNGPAPPSGIFFSVDGDDEPLAAAPDTQAYRDRLRDLQADETRPPDETLRALLRLGTEWLDVELGYLSRIDPAASTYEVVAVSGPHPTVAEGDTAALTQTYCRRVIVHDDALALENAPEQGWEGDPAYETFRLSTYFGAKVVVDGALYGTLCFADRAPRQASFSESDAAALALLVQTVEQTLERRRHEGRLQQTTARLEALFEEAPDMIAFHDADGQLLLSNPRLCEMTGYDADALARRRMWDLDVSLAPGEARDRWADMAPGDQHRREGRYRRKDGSTFPVEVDLRCLVVDGTRQFVSTGWDITAHKQAEAALREKEARLRGLANSLPGVTYQFYARPDGTWGYHFVGEKAEAVLGLSADPDGFHDRFVQCIPPEYRERYRANTKAAASEHRPARIEMPFERPDGTRIWLLCSAMPERREDEILFNGVLLDITERKRREQVLQERQDKVEALYTTTSQVLRAENKAAVGRCIVDLVNEVFGYPVVIVRFREDDRLVPVQASPDVSDHLPAPSSFDLTSESVVAAAFREGDTALFDDLSAVDDSVDYGAVRATAVVPIGTHGIISVAALEAGAIEGFDRHLIEILSTYAALVLDRIEYEGELVSAKEEAERLNRMKSAFLANMSHEIRTPLTSIIGFADVIGEEVASLTERSDSDPASFTTLDQFANLIEESGHRLLETLDAVLNLSRLEAGEMELDCTPLDLAAEVSEAADLFAPEALTEGIDLQVETAEGPLWACVDEGGLRIVLQNLLSNALKYTEEEGTVQVRAGGDGSDVVLEVEDTGVGMAPDRVPELFEPFRQESEGPGRTYEGTGLGLAVTKQAIEQMGGTIAVETAKGEGSCFTVRVPAADAPDRA